MHVDVCSCAYFIAYCHALGAVGAGVCRGCEYALCVSVCVCYVCGVSMHVCVMRVGVWACMRACVWCACVCMQMSLGGLSLYQRANTHAFIIGALKANSQDAYLHDVTERMIKAVPGFP